MWSLFQIEIAEQHQRDLRNEAEKWRMAKPKDSYQPNPAIRRMKRKRK